MIDINLVLIEKWFFMILSREKREEYRKITPYWCNVFLRIAGKRKSRSFWSSYFNFDEKQIPATGLRKLQFDLNSGLIKFIQIRNVIFSHGYKTDRDQFEIKCLNISIGEGLKHWGAKKDQKYFVISLGKIDYIIQKLTK